MERTAKQKEQTKKTLANHLVNALWKWSVSQFIWSTFEVADINGQRVSIPITFAAKMNTLSVRIKLTQKFGLPDRERTFTGENAIEDAIEWEAENLFAIVDEIGQRTSSYAQGYENYMLALQGKNIQVKPFEG